MVLVLVIDGAARNKVGQPQGVEGRKLIDLVRLLEPVLPEVEVFIIDHSAHALITQTELACPEAQARIALNSNGKKL